MSRKASFASTMQPSASHVATPMILASTKRKSVAARCTRSGSTAVALGARELPEVSVFGGSVAITSSLLLPEPDQATLRRFRHRVRTARCSELLEEMAQMNLDRALADIERFADVAVGLAGRDQTQHGHLAQRELHACHSGHELGGDR